MKNAKRPPLISIICALGIAGTVTSFVFVFAPGIKKLGIFMPALFGIIVCSRFVSLIGLWHMKKWGAELYVLSFLASLLFSILTGTFGFWDTLGIIFAVFYITVMGVYYRRMDSNL